MSTRVESLFAAIEPPYPAFDRAILGGEFPGELATTSRLWFRCGYRPGIGAYLNFFLLADFITTHDEASPARFGSFRSMARSFAATDRFVRAVTDSGVGPTGGISARGVRALLQEIMARHAALAIPPWMMTYFGLSLCENVEKECAPLQVGEQRLHRTYMAKTFRLMGIPFSAEVERMDAFARAVEAENAGTTPQLDRHARDILRLGEMVGVSSAPSSILTMLPEKTRAVFAPRLERLRPGPLRRSIARGLGRLLVPKAVGAPREAVPAEE